MTAARTAVQVTGAVIVAIAIAIIVAGVAAVTVAANRDQGGYLTTPDYELSANGHALTFGAADLQSGTDGWLPWRGLFTTRVVAELSDGDGVFVGIGPADEVAAYLADVDHTRVSELGIGPWQVDLDDEAGSTAPARPEAQEFWVAQASGTGRQSVAWEPAEGSWSIVIMNADASPGLDVTAGGGVSVGVLWPIGLALLVAGVLGLFVGIVLVSAAKDRRVAAPRPTGQPVAPLR
jgi:hypothetical protein